MRTLMRWIGLAATVCLSLSCASATSGPPGSLRGTAVDDRGNPLPGITVSLQAQDGKLVQTALTAGDGSYSIQDVPAGKYTVTTTFQGFTAPKPLSAIVIGGANVNLPPLVLLPPGVTGNSS